MLEALCGVELGPDVDVDVGSHEAMLDAVEAQWRAREAAAQQAWEQERTPAQAQAQDSAATQRKLRGALAREQREADAVAKLKQPLRDIFRKLVSALHPDREPDPVERQRKTALMQRVNVAYAADDLLGLLTLQLEVEQIDQAGLNALDETRIKQYNKILDGQLRELGEEVGAIEFAAMQEMGEHAHQTRVTPRALMRCLRVDIAHVQASLDDINAELDAFVDVQRLKAWLRTYRPERLLDDGGPGW